MIGPIWTGWDAFLLIFIFILSPVLVLIILCVLIIFIFKKIDKKKKQN